MGNQFLNKKRFTDWDDPGFFLVTGGASGLGATFTNNFCALGYTPIIIDINQEKLNDFAKKIEDRYGRQPIIMKADLTYDEDVQKVIELVKKLSEEKNIDILINNAGFGGGNDLDQNPIDIHLKMLKLHNETPLKLTYHIIPIMKKQGRGVIINVSSLGGWLPVRGAIMYAATKSFIRVFTEGLASELNKYGIICQAFCPGFVKTGFHQARKEKGYKDNKIPNFLWMTADEAISFSIKALKKSLKKSMKKVIVVPGWKNKTLAWFLTSHTFSKFARKVAAPK